jgi:hypothetical protein
MSKVRNIKFNPDKQKIIDCEICGDQVIVGKFASKTQKCERCKKIPKGAKDAQLQEVDPEDQSTFGRRLSRFATELGFTVNNNRVWKKQYAMDNGGVATVHIMIDPGVVGEKPKVDYFSMVTQRAVGVNEDFRKYMPADAASDCELLSTEFGKKNIFRPQVGRERCAKCGSLTDEFGADTKNNRILCIRPNNCFKKFFNTSGAESDG